MTGIGAITQSGAITFSCTASAIFIIAVVAARWQQRSRKKPPPTKWRRVGKITKIFIYPLKSGQGVEIEKAECTDIGLRTTEDHSLKIRDRFFIAFSDDTGSMKTARQHPHMVLIRVSHADGKKVTFEAPNMPALSVNIPEKPDENSKKKVCKLWFEETAEALDCGDEAAEWMSTYLVKAKSGVRLGYHAPGAVARRDFSKLPISSLKEFYKNIEAHDSGAFSDLASYMMMTEESVQELKGRVESEVPALSPRWFRPNFVMRGSEAFAEDDWDWVRIGDNVIFRNIKPCTRCILTTIDPETGIKNKSMEPLRTLKTYRQLSDSYAKKTGSDAPVLGVNLGLRSVGDIVRVGEPVFVSC